MAENTKIQWATHTFNPWRGCAKVAPGCANCYADAQSKRNPKTLGIWGPNGTRVVASEAMWRQPLGWNKVQQCYPETPRPRVFGASLADVFEDWPGVVVDSQGRPLHDAKAWGQRGEWIGVANTFVGKSVIRLGDVRARLFRLIDETPNLDWLLLTKRPENVRRMTHDAWTEKVVGHVSQNEGDGRRWKRRENVWLGTSIACQEDADRNAIHLRDCRDLCAKTFLSIEPLVGSVDLRRVYVGDQSQMNVDVLSWVDWVIVGGESGPNARPCNIEWIRSIVRQCQDAGVPVFVKQVGAVPITSSKGDWDAIQSEWPSGVYFDCPEDGEESPVKFVLRDPKGGDPAEWPEDVRVREVPA